ncbi:MAG TPA: MFS transporter [Porticoccaceae bacterium]|jgi:predicted MFS family arabinose efflux permease|nr:MFS transporter [Porticoccaceae bacterium]
MASASTHSIQQYSLVTVSYWAFTLTDGALRMLVLLFFHGLGFSPIEIASLFILYELSGVVTSLIGGWVAAKIGLITTLQCGLLLQILAIAMLLRDHQQLTIVYVMCAQALSGVAKDLNKISAKSSLKSLLPDNAHGRLFTWVARLTGSKNALKGMGFFLGGTLLSSVGFTFTIMLMMMLLIAILVLGLVFFKVLENAEHKPAINQILSKSTAINRLSIARLFLFGARDVWFVIALPVYLQSQLLWSYWQVGSLMALWVVGYGLIQAFAPKIITMGRSNKLSTAVDGRTLVFWGILLVTIPAAIAIALMVCERSDLVILVGLVPFAFLFAINSSVHSYLILSFAQRDRVSLDVGFYYMANAGGRLLGTLLSGFLYQEFGLSSCLFVSSGMLIASTLAAHSLPKITSSTVN